jgi:hypothetical protein
MVAADQVIDQVTSRVAHTTVVEVPGTYHHTILFSWLEQSLPPSNGFRSRSQGDRLLETCGQGRGPGPVPRAVARWEGDCHQPGGEPS